MVASQQRQKYIEAREKLNSINAQIEAAHGIFNNLGPGHALAAGHLYSAWAEFARNAADAVDATDTPDLNKQLETLAPDIISEKDVATVKEFLSILNKNEKHGFHSEKFLGALSEAQVMKLYSILESGVSKYPSVLRKKLGVPLFSKRFKLVFFVTLMLSSVISTALYFAMRPEILWSAVYFNGKNFNKQVSIINERGFDLNWGYDAPASGVKKDMFSAKFYTCLKLKAKTNVGFRLGSDDGSRLYINGEQLINNWGVHAHKSLTGSKQLEPGVHLIHIDYFEALGSASISLKIYVGNKKRSTLMTSEHLSLPQFNSDSVPSCQT